MNVFGHLKKIFNSFDFMGNRIKRLRVDTPENFIDDKNPDKAANPIYREDLKGNNPDTISTNLNRGSGTEYNEIDYERYKDFVANKDYVDKSVDYNTEISRNQESGKIVSTNLMPSDSEIQKGIVGSQLVENPITGNNEIPSRTPSQFPWVGKIFGLTVKEVLDKLLYPRIPYTYKYPELLDIKIKTDNFLIECLEQNASTNKFLICEGQDNQIYFDIKLDSGDFYNAIDAKIIFLDINENEIISIALKSGEQHISKLLDENKPNISIPINFLNRINKVIFTQKYSEYIQHYDTWGYKTIPKRLLGVEGIEFDITEEFFKQCYIWFIKQDTNYAKQISITSNNDDEHFIANIQIPEIIASDYYLKYYIYDNDKNSDNYGKLINTGYISSNEINFDGTIEYDFGYYSIPVIIKFQPISITSNKGF